VARLDLATRQRLTVVIAPIGAGKTTLLTQWVGTRRPQRVRWVTVDPHGQPETFVRDLIAALSPEGTGTHGPGTGPSSVDTVAASWRSLEDAMTVLADQPPTTLVIDDLHRLSDPVASELLDRVIGHGPRSLRLVVATQYDLPRLFYRHRLADEMVEIREADLAFRQDEAGELLRAVAGRPLPSAQVRSLWQRTEGWALALQLAALALRDAPDLPTIAHDVVTSDSHVVQHLGRELLDRQPPEVLRFLLATSVLERLHPDLCDRLLDRYDSDVRLHELNRTSMFVVRLAGDEPWWRYHHLFQILLRHRLHATDPDLERRALLLAAAWHLDRREVDVAMRYLAQAGAWERIVEHTQGAAAELLFRDEVATVGRSLGQLPIEVRRSRPEVLLLEAAAAVLKGDASRSGRALDQLAALHEVPRRVGTVATLLRAYRDHRRGATSAAIDGAERTLRQLGEGDADRYPNVFGITGSVEDLRTAAELVRGAALLYEGELTSAATALSSALGQGAPIWHIEVLGHLALLDAWAGRLRSAEVHASRAFGLARQLGPGTLVFAVEAYLANAQVARCRGQLDLAAGMVREARRLTTRRAGPVIEDLLATERALLVAETELPQAGLLSLVTRRHARRPERPRLVMARLQATEALLSLRGGDQPGAVQALGTRPDVLTEQATVRVRLCLERDDRDAARTIVASWPDDVSPRARWDRGLCGAVLAWSEGREELACEALAAVVAETAPHHHLGVFHDLGHHLQPLVRALYATSPSAFLRVVLEMAPDAPRTRSGGVLVEPLTEREQALLALLPSRLTNAEMAEAAGVSLNTVKTHLKHIYRKLAVSGRRDAVGYAEQLGLL
jgi:ATP/maltotriose-dependent transcriptional regulator MalT